MMSTMAVMSASLEGGFGGVGAASTATHETGKGRAARQDWLRRRDGERYVAKARKKSKVARAAAWTCGGMAANAGSRANRPRPQSAIRPGLSRSLCGARVHLDLPGDGTARFRTSRDRLCARPMAAGVEITEALCGKLPQSRRLSRRLHRDDRQAHRCRDQAEMAAHRRLLVSTRRHSYRRVLANRE